MLFIYYYVIILSCSHCILLRCKTCVEFTLDIFFIVSRWHGYFAASCNAFLSYGNHATMIAVAEMNNALSLALSLCAVILLRKRNTSGANAYLLYTVRPRSRFHFQRACSRRRLTVADKRIEIIFYI